MRNFTSLLLCVICISSTAQNITLNFSTYTPAYTDRKRPGAGAEQWNGQNSVNLYGSASETQSLDAYSRFSYTDIQPYLNAKGVYSTYYFDMKIQDAIKKRQKFSFSIMPICSFCTGHGNQEAGLPNPNGSYLFYPLWLHNAMQQESVKDWQSSATGSWWPNWNSPTWLAAWKAMNVFIYNHIMNTTFQGVRYRDVINYVDAGGYGQTGEWTNIIFHGGGTDATVASLDSIYAGTARTFSQFRVVSQIATFDGKQVYGNTNIPADVGWFALQFKNMAGPSGIRRENMGATDVYIDWWLTNNHTTYVIPSGYPGAGSTYHFDTAIQNRYKYAPTTGEPCCVTNSFASLPGQMATYHVSSFGNGNFSGSEGDFTTIQNNVRTAARAAGYGLVLDGGSLQISTPNPDDFNIQLAWKNRGVAPPYEHWNIEFQLVKGTEVRWTGVSSFDPYLFLPATSDKLVNDQYSLKSVTPGTGYVLKMFIKDPNGYSTPMPLYISTPQNSDGSYTLQSNITISNNVVASDPAPVGISVFTNQAPTSQTQNDVTGGWNRSSGQEMGMRFKSSVSGTITGIRFYKTAGNNGTHTGELYSASGTRLAQATFTNETATGWQFVKFSSPVTISANTIYTAAYFSSQGFFVRTTNYFLNRSVTNSTLTAPADGTNGGRGTSPANGQGTFQYTSSPLFPDQLYLSSNYWVDVVFNPGSTVVNSGGALKSGIAIDGTPDSTTATPDDNPLLKLSYSLGQNYPNPVTGSTRIEYTIAVAGKTSLILHDIQGRPSSILVNEIKQPGVYYYDLNTGGLMKGLYFYSLDAGTFHSVKKMLVE